MLQHLHQEEEVLIYSNKLHISTAQELEVVSYLKQFYETESLNYPHQAPQFDANAAIWAAQTVYLACQLILLRENKGSDLGIILPPYQQSYSASAILSADLTLRFLPDIISQASVIDPTDPLIAVLESHLMAWHYSGVNYTLKTDNLAFATINSNNCLKQLYVDRIIEYKKNELAQLPIFQPAVKASLGWFASTLWGDFELKHKAH